MSGEQHIPQEQENADFFESLYDVKNHAVQKPRVIGGGKISREQAAALGIPTDGTIHQK